MGYAGKVQHASKKVNDRNLIELDFSIVYIFENIEKKNKDIQKHIEGITIKNTKLIL